jgi:hypothetical protein
MLVKMKGVSQNRTIVFLPLVAFTSSVYWCLPVWGSRRLSTSTAGWLSADGKASVFFIVWSNLLHSCRLEFAYTAFRLTSFSNCQWTGSMAANLFAPCAYRVPPALQREALCLLLLHVLKTFRYLSVFHRVLLVHNIKLRHPVAVRRSDFAFRFSAVYAQRRLVVSRSFHFINTTCSGLSGHHQVYRLLWWPDRPKHLVSIKWKLRDNVNRRCA